MSIKRAVTGSSIAVAIVGVTTALIWRYESLVSDDMLLAVLGFIVMLTVGAALTLLGWVIGAAFMEGHKWNHLEPDDPNAERPQWKKPATKRKIRKWATMYGGTVTTLMMLLWLWPPTWQQVAFCFIYGYGIGGMLLPVVYVIALKVLLPRVMVKLGFKMVINKKGITEYRLANHQSEEGEHTTLAPDRTERLNDPKNRR
jgi:hypothetical protein